MSQKKCTSSSLYQQATGAFFWDTLYNCSLSTLHYYLFTSPPTKPSSQYSKYHLTETSWRSYLLKLFLYQTFSIFCDLEDFDTIDINFVKLCIIWSYCDEQLKLLKDCDVFTAEWEEKVNYWYLLLSYHCWGSYCHGLILQERRIWGVKLNKQNIK